MLADVSCAGQDLVNRSNAPTSASRCSDAFLVEIIRNEVGSQRTALPVADTDQAKHETDMLGLSRVDLQLLLGPGAPLLCGNDAVTERWT
jgi:hypothetical protein